MDAAATVDDLVRPTLVLAAQRAYPPALAGRWELPRGQVDPGQDPAEALNRELAEELGVTAVLGAEVAAPPPRCGVNHAGSRRVQAE